MPKLSEIITYALIVVEFVFIRRPCVAGISACGSLSSLLSSLISFPWISSLLILPFLSSSSLLAVTGWVREGVGTKETHPNPPLVSPVRPPPTPPGAFGCVLAYGPLFGFACVACGVPQNDPLG